MKLKSFILSCAISVWIWSASAQSTFRLENFNSFSGINAPVFDAEGARLSGANYAAELWGGIASNSLSPTSDFESGQRVIVPFATGVSAGYFTSTKSMTVFQAAGNGLAWVQVRAWDTRLGATYEEVSALGTGGYGESALLFARGGDPNGAPPTSPRPLIGLQSFSLRPIPEPSIWQLSLLGLPALLLLRRKGR